MLGTLKILGKKCIAHIPLEFACALTTQHKRSCHKQHEFYMANTILTLVYATQTIYCTCSRWVLVGLVLGPQGLALGSLGFSPNGMLNLRSAHVAPSILGVLCRIAHHCSPYKHSGQPFCSSSLIALKTTTKTPRHVVTLT